MNKTLAVAGLLPALVFACTVARGEDPLDLNEAVRLSVGRQPLLEASRRAASAARERATAEAQLPDPKLKLGVQNLLATGKDAFRLDRDDMTMTTIGLMQDMVRSDKREAAAERTRAEADQWDAEAKATARAIRRDAALAWLDAFEAARRAEFYRRMAEDMAAERRVAAARLSSGMVEARELFQLDAMLAMSNDKRLAAERDERKARALLGRWIGGAAAARPLSPDLPTDLPADRPAVAISVPPSPGEALQRHPALAVARQAERVARKEADMASAERKPNWSWELMYGVRQGGRDDMVSAQVAIDLPWDRPQRQDRRVAEKLALAERAQDLADDRLRELAAELASARADEEAAAAREREHVERLIPAAQARLAVAQARYAAGQLPLAPVWEARRGALEVELEHWLIRTDRARAAVRLAYLLNEEEAQP